MNNPHFHLFIISLLLTSCDTPFSQSLSKDYQRYDRTHERKITVSYDGDTKTTELGYTIIPFSPKCSH